MFSGRRPLSFLSMENARMDSSWVFPVPGPARTRTGPLVESTASACSSLRRANISVSSSFFKEFFNFRNNLSVPGIAVARSGCRAMGYQYLHTDQFFQSLLYSRPILAHPCRYAARRIDRRLIFVEKLHYLQMQVRLKYFICVCHIFPLPAWLLRLACRPPPAAPGQL